MPQSQPVKLSSTQESLLLLVQLPMTPDCWLFQRDSELLPWDSPTKPDKESPPPRDNALLSINWPKSPQLGKTSSLSEVQEIEKLKDISVFTQVKRDPTLPQELDAKEDISKEPEEEDDSLPI